MAFECVHCQAVIEDETLKIPRSGAQCPNCKKDPTEGWSPYMPEVAEAGRKLADEMYLRLMIQDFGVREATLFFLEDLLLEQRHELAIKLGRKPGIEHKCSVCGSKIPPDEGFRIELYDAWRSTRICIGLCERHLSQGMYGRELDLHANHPDPWLTRGDVQYPPSIREQAHHPTPETGSDSP
jgi:hypothetical protein